MNKFIVILDLLETRKLSNTDVPFLTEKPRLSILCESNKKYEREWELIAVTALFVKVNAALLQYGRDGLKSNLAHIIASPSCKSFLFMLQELPWDLICPGRSDTSKCRCSPKLFNKLLPKSNTRSRSKLFQHYTLRNFAQQSITGTLHSSSFSKLLMILIVSSLDRFEEQAKALLTYVLIGYQ